MENRLDKDSPIPLYYQVERIIVEEIENGNYPVGSMIPTEKELSEFFDISRTTVRQAIIDLVREGKLYRVKSKGTFVKKQKINQDLEKTLQFFCSDVANSGGVARTEVLKLEKTELPANIARDAKMDDGSEVVVLSRLLFSNDDPVVKTDSYFWKTDFSKFKDKDFSKDSYLDILSSNQETALKKIVRTCEACKAGYEDEMYLKMQKGSPILYVKTWGYNENEELIEFTVSRHRGDYSKFTVTIYDNK